MRSADPLPDPLLETGDAARSFRTGPAFADMAALVRRVRDIVQRHRSNCVVYRADEGMRTFLAQAGFKQRGMGPPETILSEQTAVELGHPSTPSLATVLLTYSKDMVSDGVITLLGPDLDLIPTGSRYPFAQVVMCAVSDQVAVDPFEIDALQYLTHRLPGYMVRSVPGKLWVRISKAALSKGLRIGHVGTALIETYRKEVQGIEAVEVIYVTSPRVAVEELGPVVHEATILSGRHKKLYLGVDGEVECRELNCQSCDEKPVCDTLRDVVIARRNKRQ